MNTKTIDQVFVPSTLGDTTGSMDASIISSLDDAWARRVKIDDTSKALSVVYGKAWVEPVRVFAASRQWSKREKWYHRSTHKYSTLVSMFAFATAGTSRSYAVRDIVFDELRGFNDIANEFRGDKYGRKKFNYNVGTGRQTTVPDYVSAACAPGARFGVPVPWDGGAIGKNVGYLEFEAVYTGWDLFKDESYPNIDKLLIEDVSQSNNPADCIYDYLTDTFYGAGFDPALLDASSFQAVRDYFDTQITSSNYTGPYLEFNVALSTGDEFKDNLNKMLSQSRCALVDRDGRIALVVEREINPVFELDSSNIVGAINLQLPEASNKYNRIVARYKPDSFSGEEAIFVYPRLPEDRDLWEAWYAEDGRISQTEVTFDCISNKDQIAQQLEIFAKRSRFGRMLECEVMGQATLLEVFDVVQITHDYYNLNKHEFMVESRKPDDKKGTVKLKLRAYDSAIYPFDTNRTVEDESYSRIPGAIVCTITDVQYIVHPDLSATVSWEYEANADVSFEVYVDSDAEETSFTGTTGSNQIVVTGLEKGTYELVITGVANGRNAAGSHTSTISIYEPDSPITPIPKVTHNSIELSASLSHGWSVDESLQFYISETAQQPANPFARGVNAVATDLKPSTKYYYWITAVNRAGESAAVSDDVTTLRAPNAGDFGAANKEHGHTGAEAGRFIQDAMPDSPVEGDVWMKPGAVGGAGGGTVESVNNKQPDANGNVDIDYQDVGAAQEQHTHSQEEYTPAIASNISAADSASLWPNGVSISSVGGANSDYPIGYGTVVTFKLSNVRVFQFMHTNSAGGQALYHRSLYNDDPSAWYQIASREWVDDNYGDYSSRTVAFGRILSNNSVPVRVNENRGNVIWDWQDLVEYKSEHLSDGESGSNYNKAVTPDIGSGFAGGKALGVTTYQTHYSDFLEVEPGERLFGEMWVKGDGANRYYFGIERFDKDKKPIATNNGTTYFVASNKFSETTWRKDTGQIVIPTSHTPYDGSDGSGVKYVRVRLLLNRADASQGLCYYGGCKLYRTTRGPVGLNEGSQAYPSLHFESDPSLGFWQSSSGEVTFTGDFNTLGELTEQGERVYSPNNKPTGESVGRFIQDTAPTSPKEGDAWMQPGTVSAVGGGVQTVNGVSPDGSGNVTLSASDITTGTFSTGRIPNLAASKITSGTFNGARLPAPTSSVRGGVKLSWNSSTKTLNIITT
ncbi:hypothetical protein [Paraferrimonas haliotis]|uniref:Fibronectin type-III domain-containing protein n=1 Tax=Paraferrimonas haliotis TaxID=2013866 RepID=A0AA37TXK0_9GAMM|nr:hypothetical protein [Paraferrimonas haliotis]GLS83216.1 hypothetical protein GCM10007894_11930 [Paraferrimonas haliotis]